MAKHELLLYEGQYDEDKHFDKRTGKIVQGLTPVAKLIIEADKLEGPGSASALAWKIVGGCNEVWFGTPEDLPDVDAAPPTKQAHTDATVSLLKEKLRDVSRQLATVTADLLNTVRD